MELIFLGKVSENGESPTLYASDRDSYVVQGYRVSDAERVALSALADGETVVEVYAMLLDYLPREAAAPLQDVRESALVGTTQRGNLLVRGVRLADASARQQLAIPDHEDAVEVPRTALRRGSACA